MKTRTEDETLKLIVGFAEADERIRVTLMNGSRANPEAARDLFQDYDIANLVTEVAPFRDYDYIRSHFGEAIVVQAPEAMVYVPPVGDGRFNYNMQLVDGNRIDLSFFALDTLEERLADSLTVVLVDKDGRVPDLPPPSERSYFITKPTEQLFADCCNEFFFGLGSHVPKTLWRRSWPLLQVYMRVVLREPLVTMLGWEVGGTTGFDKSIGKAGSRLGEYLPPERWEQFLRTYPDCDPDRIWESLRLLYELFMTSAQIIADANGFHFSAETGRKAWAFLEHVHQLPDNATSVFE